MTMLCDNIFKVRLSWILKKRLFQSSNLLTLNQDSWKNIFGFSISLKIILKDDLWLIAEVDIKDDLEKVNDNKKMFVEGWFKLEVIEVGGNRWLWWMIMYNVWHSRQK